MPAGCARQSGSVCPLFQSWAGFAIRGVISRRPPALAGDPWVPPLGGGLQPPRFQQWGRLNLTCGWVDHADAFLRDKKGNPVLCPHCNAELDADVVRQQAFCPGCGKAFPAAGDAGGQITERVSPADVTVRDATVSDATTPNGNGKPPVSAHQPGEPPRSAYLRPSLHSIPPGGLTFGQYRVIERIGRGGMGDVFEAEQKSPARKVALKVLSAGRLARSDQRARFLREAAAVALLKHPSIVPIYESGEREDGTLYYTMELVEGKPLDQFAEGEGLVLQDKLGLFINVCEGVQAAHQQGVIHRDLKPSNILVDLDGHPRILDFGLAKIISEGPADSAQLTQTGHVIGTPAYMAPEQLSGDVSGIDTRTDVYTLGVVLYRLVTGTFPYSVSHGPMEILRQIERGDPVRPRAVVKSLPTDLEAILLKAIAKDKDRRYQSPLELAQDLRRFLASQPVLARLPTTTYKLGKLIQRNKVASVVGAVSAVLLIIVLVGSFARIDAARRTAEEQRDLALRADDKAKQEADRARQEKEKAILAEEAEAEERAKATLACLTAQRESYYALIARAEKSRNEHRLDEAWELLGEAPRELRGWEWGRLGFSLLCLRELLTIRGAGFLRQALAFSPDGERIASCVLAEQVVVSDAWTGKRLVTLLHGDHHTGNIAFRAITFSPEGQHLLAAHSIRTGNVRRMAVSVWRTGRDAEAIGEYWRRRWRLSPLELELGRPFPDTEHTTWAVGGSPFFAPAANRVVAFCDVRGLEREPFAEIWDAQLARKLRVRPLPGLMRPLALSPDGRYVISVEHDANSGAARGVRVHDLETGSRLTDLEVHAKSGVFGPESRRVLTVSGDGILRVWEVKTGRELVEIDGRPGLITAAIFSPCGRHILAGTRDGAVKMWDSQKGKQLQPVRHHGYTVTALAFSPDGFRFAASGRHGPTKIWETHTEENSTGFAVSPAHISRPPYAWAGFRVNTIVHASGDDGHWLAVAGADGPVRVWDLQTREEVFSRGVQGEVVDMAVGPSASGPRLAVLAGGKERAEAKVWELVTGEELLRFEIENPVPESDTLCGSVALSPDGSQLGVCVCSPNHPQLNVQVWDLDEKRKTAEPVVYRPPPASKAGDTMDDLEALFKESFERSPTSRLAFSARGRFLVISGRGGGLGPCGQVWDIGSCVKLLDIDWLTNCGHMAVSHDGLLLAYANSGREAGVADLRTGKRLSVFRGSSASGSSLAFSRDNKRVATGSADKRARIWNTSTGRGILSLQDQTSAVVCVGFGPDGDLTTVGMDGTVISYPVSDWTKDLAELRKERLERCRARSRQMHEELQAEKRLAELREEAQGERQDSQQEDRGQTRGQIRGEEQAQAQEQPIHSLGAPGPNAVSDPEGNLYGDAGRRYLDVVRASVEEKDDRYVLAVVTAGDFPAPEEMQGKRFDFIWIIDADRRMDTGQSWRGNDYNIHLYLTEHGWGRHFFRVSAVSKAHDVRIDPTRCVLEARERRVILSFPTDYLPSNHFCWQVESTTQNARDWSPLTGNPLTPRTEFGRPTPRTGPAD